MVRLCSSMRQKLHLILLFLLRFLSVSSNQDQIKLGIKLCIYLAKIESCSYFSSVLFPVIPSKFLDVLEMTALIFNFLDPNSYECRGQVGWRNLYLIDLFSSARATDLSSINFMNNTTKFFYIAFQVGYGC